MKTLIIITLLLLVLTIVLIVLIAKKFLDKTDYILASNAIVSNNITDNANKILKLLESIEKFQQDNVNKILYDIQDKFATNNHMLSNGIGSIEISIKALTNSVNAIEEKLSTVPNSEDIIDSDELVNRIAEGLYNKMMDLQAKNSLSTTKTKKPSLHKAKTTGKLKTAVKQDNSQQERINEIAKQQNK